ncbi:MAG: Tex family protein [Bacilli bacterium]
MHDVIINGIVSDLNIKKESVIATLKLLEEGSTIPFIARYRKEVTGALDEEQIRNINEVYEYQVNLLKRKEDVIRLIDEKGLLTPEIRDNIMKCDKLVEVEDIYRPYKEKKKTKATEAIKNGLEPLAKIIMTFKNIDINKIAESYLNDNVKDIETAIKGASYIIAEWISDNASYRKYIRNNMINHGIIHTKKKKNSNDENGTYEMYYNYEERVKFIKPHRILAINRGEKEDILTVNIEVDNDYIISYLENRIIKNKDVMSYDIVKEAIKDSYKRLIFPSVEREVRSELKDISEEAAIKVFGDNLENLLLTPPMKDITVLGFDPAFRTGCKLAVVSPTSSVLNISVIYPHEPHNKWDEAKSILKDLFKKYDIDVVSIGNGTASRESEKLVAEAISEYKDKNVKYVIVSEAGASVYSASELAIHEFPDLTVEKRSAISIARRFQDPLSELVKIDSKSIGVGQYQHDVNEKKLDESLDFVVSKCVNNVGVNVNTASPSILKYVSGLTKTAIEKIVNYREKNGKIKSRNELIKNKVLSSKTYEQSIGFMRIIDGDNPMDVTSIHPESYDISLKLLNTYGFDINDIGSKKLSDVLTDIDVKKVSSELGTDIYTLEDIIKCLMRPNRDFRDDFDKPILKSDILRFEDLKVGMELSGTVRNVVDFGAFIDIGLHDDGLVHISKMTDKYIKHPSEIVSVGDIVTCYVDNVSLEKGKVSLSLINPNLIKN